MSVEPPFPDPALLVLVGPAGAGKSHWAAGRFRRSEIVSSDALRAVVGTGEADLDASADAFAVLDLMVTARLRRGLTTVIDTLGLDADRRAGYLALARTYLLPAVAVVFTTKAGTCRRRNAHRDRPVAAAALRSQLARRSTAIGDIDAESWDRVIVVDAADPTDTKTPTAAAVISPTPAPVRPKLDFVLQLSRFPWGKNPTRWLTEVAVAAEQCGFAGVALMDHLIQIPQVDRAWEPIPEPFVTLGLLAGATSRLRLGTLVSPVTFRPPGILAKAAATLDALSGGGAFLGLGAGWWEREHAGFGLDFPSAAARLDQLETAIEMIRALWSPGTKAYHGQRVQLPETTCYPRPTGRIPIIIGGSGEQRTLQIAARLGDACNLPSKIDVLDAKIAVLRRHCADLNRDPDEVAVTVLDVPIIGHDREEVSRIVEKLRGRTAAAAFAARHHAGTVDEQIRRYQTLAERGVRTVFVALPDLAGPTELFRFAEVTATFPR